MELTYLNTNHKEFHLEEKRDEIIREGVLSIENFTDIKNGELWNTSDLFYVQFLCEFCFTKAPVWFLAFLINRKFILVCIEIEKFLLPRLQKGIHNYVHDTIKWRKSA